jgi:hypothetical protein
MTSYPEWRQSKSVLHLLLSRSALNLILGQMGSAQRVILSLNFREEGGHRGPVRFVRLLVRISLLDPGQNIRSSDTCLSYNGPQL